MTKIKKNKTSDSDTKVENYYIHIVEPEQKIQNFKFINISDFTKKRNKKQKCNIYIGDLLEYFDKNTTINILQELAEKLDIGSKIYIQGIDAKSIAQSFASDELTEIMYNVMIYGLGKKSIFSFPNIKRIINTISALEIESVRFINSINYYIECNKV